MATEDRPPGSDRKWRQDLFDSDALRINLEETAVEQVAVDPKYEVLRETVADYRGISKTLDTLLFELNHPFKNWEIILPELRAFALKNFTSYARHPKGPQAIAVILDVFLDAVMNSAREDLQARAVEYLLGYLEKIVTELDPLQPGKLPSGREGVLPAPLLDAGKHVFPARLQPYPLEADRPGPAPEAPGRTGTG